MASSPFPKQQGDIKLSVKAWLHLCGFWKEHQLLGTLFDNSSY
jgi:hypothetical protein